MIKHLKVKIMNIKVNTETEAASMTNNSVSQLVKTTNLSATILKMQRINYSNNSIKYNLENNCWSCSCPPANDGPFSDNRYSSYNEDAFSVFSFSFALCLATQFQCWMNNSELVRLTSDSIMNLRGGTSEVPFPRLP